MSDILDFPAPLVCPVCREAKLTIVDKDKATTNPEICCQSCNRTYAIRNGFMDLIVGDRFEDDKDSECLNYEEYSNEYTTFNYWIPLFQAIGKEMNKPLNILAVGCGIGLEVDLICEAGFNCVGIDNGNRSKVWHKRSHSRNFIMANGMNLPFPDGFFDIVFCGCVFPHVGVVGDSIQVKTDYLEQRTVLALEMKRVLHPEGRIFVASPNRNFPMDIFHNRDQGQLTAHINRPREKFLLSVKDYKKIFSSDAPVKIQPLPVTGYWGFVRSKNSIKGLIAGLPIRLMFQLVSKKGFKFLRSSMISPWIVVSIRKVRG